MRRHISTLVDFPSPAGGKIKRYRRVHLRALDARIAKRVARQKRIRDKQKGRPSKRSAA